MTKEEAEQMTAELLALPPDTPVLVATRGETNELWISGIIPASAAPRPKDTDEVFWMWPAN